MCVYNYSQRLAVKLEKKFCVNVLRCMWYDQILRRNKFQLYSTKMSRYLHSKVYIYTKKQTAYFHFYDTHPKHTIFWLLSEYSRGQFRLFTGPIVIFHCESIHWYWKWFCRDLLKFLQSRIVPVFNNQGSINVGEMWTEHVYIILGDFK